MSDSLFSGKRTAQNVAYDLALALAAKDQTITTPQDLLDRVLEIYPECYEVTKHQWSKENPTLGCH